MKPAVNSKKKAVILGVLVGVFTLWWYSSPFFWVGAAMGLFGGFFTFFILSTKRMERLRVYFFMGLAVFVLVTITANILYIGFTSFMQWVAIWDTSYYVPGEGRGTSPFPLPILIPSLLLGKANFLLDQSVWETVIPSRLDMFFLFMIPYVITFLVFDRAFCGWICPLGGLPEGVATLTKKRRVLGFLKFLERKPSAPGEFSLTGFTGLKGWVEWVRYGILFTVILVSFLVPFSVVNIISPALWLKSLPVFWTIIGIVIVFAVVLPFVTKRRWWCDVICPVGTSMAMLHKIGPFRIKIDKNKCTQCMDCVQDCRMYAMTPQGVEVGEVKSGNCIKCGRCIEVCPEEAIDLAWLGKYRNIRGAFIPLVITATLAWYLWFVVLLASYSTKINQFFD